MPVYLTDVCTIHRLTIKRRHGSPVAQERLPRYVVYTPDGRALEEFRRKHDAVRWSRAMKDSLTGQEGH